MPIYGPRKTEEKWQKRWEKAQIYRTDLKAGGIDNGGKGGRTKTARQKDSRPKYYNLVMFPYPSGDKLHIGHWYNYAPADSWGRYMRMRGHNVFEPMGYDSFGLPAENYALKTGVHPAKSIAQNIGQMREQLKRIGTMYDYSKEIVTSEPRYYKWTQWIFLQLYKKGLAYRKKAPVNWCPSCQTVLANEQVQDGRCERCKHEVTKRDLVQWFFGIRDYAERLLKYDGLDWPERTKLMQQHWIGRSEGSEIYFQLEGKYKFVFIHGFNGDSSGVFFPWLKKELEKLGHSVTSLDLPNPEKPREDEQVSFVLKHASFDDRTIIIGHSLGAVVTLKILEKLKKPVAGVLLIGGFLDPTFRDKKRPFDKTFKWHYDFERIRENAGFVKILSDRHDYAIPLAQGRKIQEKTGGELIETTAQKPHFTAEKEPSVLLHAVARLKVFTTRIDTLFGATYMVLAPEHPLVKQMTLPRHRKNVEEYVEKTRRETDIARSSEDREKNGVDTGAFAINPATGEKIPVWIGDFVLMSYGTGAVMAVPAHDIRDMAFAKKYGLQILEVIAGSGSGLGIRNNESGIMNEAMVADGILKNSGKFTGMSSAKARQAITKWLQEKSLADFKVNYKLRDWLVSRQRYWGVPIPIIYCEKCGEVAVAEKDLPVKLPLDVDFTPKGDGKSPLNTVSAFVKTVCPQCGGKAQREVDTMDTFVDSSWYFLRYPCADLEKKPFDAEMIKKWLPVDMYIGGPEHACMHLLYARFINMVLFDLGHICFEEPFKRLVHQGMITKDGAKMSKSKGNVVSPDQFVEKYGSDVFRMYLMFMGPFTEGGDWNDQGITGIARFVEKFYVLMKTQAREGGEVPDQAALQKVVHRTIKKVTEDIEKFQFNTAVAALMEFVNSAQKTGTDLESKKLLTILIAPLAPHLAEEIWEMLGEKFSIFDQSWPSHDKKLITDTTLTLPIQVNGKLRGQIVVASDVSKEQILALARGEEHMAKYLAGGKVQKEIYVPGRMVNFVIADNAGGQPINGPSSNRSGFTLVEMIVVLALTLFLFVVALKAVTGSTSQLNFANTHEQVLDLVNQARSLAISGKAQPDYTDFDNDGCTDLANNPLQNVAMPCTAALPDMVTPAHYGVHFHISSDPLNPYDTVTLFVDNHALASGGGSGNGKEGVFDAADLSSLPGDYWLGKDIVLQQLTIPSGLHLFNLPGNAGNVTDTSIFYSPIFADMAFDVPLQQNQFFTFGLQQTAGGISRQRCTRIQLLAGIPENAACP